MSKKNKKKLLSGVLSLLLVLVIYIVAYYIPSEEAPADPADAVATPSLNEDTPQSSPNPGSGLVSVESLDGEEDTEEEEGIPEYSGEAWYVINNNEPFFDTTALTPDAFERFAPLDKLGRCGITEACIGTELMPTAPRESISHIKPTGWVNVPYSFVDGEMLYNRCHLIGFQLAGENANKKNLITGTRYLNIEGMLPFENMVADYIKETGNHVYYRVTPIFEGEELVARGVTMEAWSIEDSGEGICYNVYCYNVQPGVIIDYASGESRLDEEFLASGEQHEYVLNTGSKKFHLPECSGATDMKAENRQEYTGSRELLIAQGFQPCGQCQP